MPLIPPRTAEEIIKIVSGTGRSTSLNLREQLALEVVKADPSIGKILPFTMNDPRWPASEGWVKMQQIINGIVIHYIYNIYTGIAMDFKFK